MILDILGGKSLKVDGEVQIDYRNRRPVIYCSETTKHLIVNPDEIVAITISKKTEMK